MKKKIVIVTGSSGFLGRAIVNNLILADYFVLGIDIAKNMFKHKNFEFFQCNLASEKSIEQCITKIVKKYEILCLINNAAIDHKVMQKGNTDFIHYDLRKWRKTFSINVDAIFLLCKHVCKYFEKNKKGNIINISSTYGLVAPRNDIYKFKKNFKKNLDYSTSKSAVIGFTKSLASYYSNTQIRINCVCPGGIYNMQNKKFIKNYSNNTIIGRMAELNEIANAIKFLVSEDSSYMTGSVLVVDGGWTAI